MFVFGVINDPDYPNKLTQKNYDEITKRSYPYIQVFNRENASYAICPACKNPVRLVNKNSSERISGTLYAMHVKYNVKDLADYNQSEYDDCYLRNPERMDAKVRRNSSQNGLSEKIRSKLREHFDLVVAIMKTVTGIKFSDIVIEEMLNDFSLNRGHTYRAMTLFNIPYGFLYMTEAQDLYNCQVSGKIVNEINKNSNQFICNGFGYIGRKNNMKGNKIILFFSDHKIDAEDKKQTIKLNIAEIGYKENPEDGVVLYQQIIVVDNNIFDNYIRVQKRMLDLAQSIIP